MPTAALIEANYLPSIEYFFFLRSEEKIILEKHEVFEKQTFRNRCLVNTSQGVIMLTVPLAGRHGKILTKDVMVEAGNKWRNTHWRTLESAYRKAPFFEFYSDDLKKILFSGHELLFDLNLSLLSFCLQSIRFEKQITVSLSYELQAGNEINDLRNRVSNKKRSYSNDFFQPTSYPQVFGNSFVSNLSLIDLLFCCGPQSFQIIQSSIKKNE